MTATPEHTWQDLQDAIGQDFSDGQINWGIEPLEWVAIRRFCEPLELDCPLYYSTEVARQHGYKDIPLPLSMYTSVGLFGIWKPGDPTRWPVPERNMSTDTDREATERPLPMPMTTAGFATSREIEYIQPIYVGDWLGVRGSKLISVAVRETSVGHGAFIVLETEFLNQRNELVALSRTGGYRYNPHAQDARPASGDEPEAQQQPPKERTVPPARASYTDWSKQRYYEDVEVGDEVPPVTIHLTVQRLVIEAGANRAFPPIHHNTEVAQALGAPEMFANNGFIQAMWERTYREFIGLDGVVKKVGPFRIQTFNTAGDSVVTPGVVKRKWQENGENLVELEMWCENSKGISVGPGPVLVALPSKPRQP